MSNKPVKTYFDNNVRVAIFRNTGKNGVFYSVKDTAVYKDNDGAYQNGDSYTGTQPLTLANFMTQAHNHILELKAQDREANQEETIEDAA